MSQREYKHQRLPQNYTPSEDNHAYSLEENRLLCPSQGDHEAGHAYWQSQGQLWRTEPEISLERQHVLEDRREIVPDIEQGIYPFKGLKMSRADVEWLLATHENGQGPIDWNDKGQRDRNGLDLRGVDLSDMDLSDLPLARMIGGVSLEERLVTTLHQRRMAAIHLERANLSEAHLEGAILRNAHLEGTNLEQVHLENADCAATHFEEAYLRKAYLGGTYLRRAHFESSTYLNEISLGDESVGFLSLLDIIWGGVNLSTIQWQQMTMLGHEKKARQKRTDKGVQKDNATQLHEYEVAIRANRQLSIELQSQGLNEEAMRFAYHAQVLQKIALRLQIFRPGIKQRQRLRSCWSWLFSWLLYLLAGYGYKPERSLLAYFFVIGIFTFFYHILVPQLAWNEAFVISMTAFHGRGFFPGTFSPADPLAFASAFEAFVGLIIEIIFIATLTQRFFSK